MIIVLLWHLWTLHVKKLLTIGPWNCPMTKKLFLVCVHEPEVTELDVWLKIKPAYRKIHRQNAVTWHLECQIPLINCYLISFLSTSFRSAVVVCLITYANSVGLKILVNWCTQGRRWTRLHSDGGVNKVRPFREEVCKWRCAAQVGGEMVHLVLVHS